MPFTRATDSATVMNTHALTKHYGDVHAVGGLDPAGIIEVRELLRRLAHKNGVTVFMSSHILAEVAHLADRIGIIHEGRLLQGSPTCWCRSSLGSRCWGGDPCRRWASHSRCSRSATCSARPAGHRGSRGPSCPCSSVWSAAPQRRCRGAASWCWRSRSSWGLLPRSRSLSMP